MNHFIYHQNLPYQPPQRNVSQERVNYQIPTQRLPPQVIIYDKSFKFNKPPQIPNKNFSQNIPHILNKPPIPDPRTQITPNFKRDQSPIQQRKNQNSPWFSLPINQNLISQSEKNLKVEIYRTEQIPQYYIDLNRNVNIQKQMRPEQFQQISHGPYQSQPNSPQVFQQLNNFKSQNLFQSQNVQAAHQYFQNQLISSDHFLQPQQIRIDSLTQSNPNFGMFSQDTNRITNNQPTYSNSNNNFYVTQQSPSTKPNSNTNTTLSIQSHNQKTLIPAKSTLPINEICQQTNTFLNQVPYEPAKQKEINNEVAQMIAEKQSFLTYELRYIDEDNNQKQENADDLDNIQIPNVSMFQDKIFNVIFNDNISEVEREIDFQNFNSEMKITELLKQLLQKYYRSMKNPGLYILLGKARKRLVHPHKTLMSLINEAETNQLLIEELQINNQ